MGAVGATMGSTKAPLLKGEAPAMCKPSYRWVIVVMFLEYAGWSATISVLPKLETEFFGANAILVSTLSKGVMGKIATVRLYIL